MSSTTSLGFFAYPSTPPSISEIIRTATHEINAGGTVHIKPWEELIVAGRVLMSAICSEIERSELFCVDLTGLNANAMFELGYAIALNRHIWPVFDSSFTTFKSQFDQFRTLTTLGYAPYTNSTQLVRHFYEAQPQFSPSRGATSVLISV